LTIFCTSRDERHLRYPAPGLRAGGWVRRTDDLSFGRPAAVAPEPPGARPNAPHRPWGRARAA